MELDVVVVGASTAGLHAAALLARGGAKVGVFERARLHSPARRTLIVTSAFRRMIATEASDGFSLHRIRMIGLEAAAAKKTIQLQDPDAVVERLTLTRVLRRRAESAGCRILLGHRFNRFEKCGRSLRVVFDTRNGPMAIIAKRAVVGADGVLTDVGKAARIGRPSAVPIVQAEVQLPSSWNPELAKVWFNVAETRFFYWLIPESDSRGVIGLIGDRGSRMRVLLDRFLRKQNLKALAYQAANVAMYRPGFRPWGRIGQLPVYLVGDAAGHVKVTTVGGTVTGFAGARAAADSILQGKSYGSELRSLKRELNLHWLIRHALDRLDSKGYKRLVGSIGGQARSFLGRHDRDSFASVCWKLPFLEPRLIGLGMRSFLRRRPAPVHTGILDELGRNATLLQR